MTTCETCGYDYPSAIEGSAIRGVCPECGGYRPVEALQ